jgi:ribosomal protein S14
MRKVEGDLIEIQAMVVDDTIRLLNPTSTTCHMNSSLALMLSAEPFRKGLKRLRCALDSANTLATPYGRRCDILVSICEHGVMPIEPTALYTALTETGRFYETDRVGVPEPVIVEVPGGVDVILDDGEYGIEEQRCWFGVYREADKSIEKLVDYLTSFGAPSRAITKQMDCVLYGIVRCTCGLEQTIVDHRWYIGVMSADVYRLGDSRQCPTDLLIQWASCYTIGGICEQCNNHLPTPSARGIAKLPRLLNLFVYRVEANAMCAMPVEFETEAGLYELRGWVEMVGNHNITFLRDASAKRRWLCVDDGNVTISKGIEKRRVVSATPVIILYQLREWKSSHGYQIAHNCAHCGRHVSIHRFWNFLTCRSCLRIHSIKEMLVGLQKQMMALVAVSGEERSRDLLGALQRLYDIMEDGGMPRRVGAKGCGVADGLREVTIVLKNFVSDAAIITADAQIGPARTFHDIMRGAYCSWMNEALAQGIEW